MTEDLLADAVKLYVYLMREDDPRKCTSAKLARHGLARVILRPSAIPKGSLALNPTSIEILLPADDAIVSVHGLMAIDCSWKNLDRVFRRGFSGVNRRLPKLLAANPTNYGQLGKLSSVEALGAALSITNHRKQAENILSKFKWGENFLVLNEDPLEDYSRAKDRDDVRELERQYFELGNERVSTRA